MQKNTWYMYVMVGIVGILIILVFIIVRLYTQQTPAIVMYPVPTSTVRTGIRGTPTSSWPVYYNADMNFYVLYPPQMTVHEESGAVLFTYWGSSQREGTELYDGISVTMEKILHPSSESVDDYIVDKLHITTSTGTILVPISTTTVGGIISKTVTVQTLGIVTYLFVPKTITTTVEISYANPDPSHEGYDSVVGEMIQSFVFGASSSTMTSSLPIETEQIIHPNITFYDFYMAFFNS